MAENSPPKTLFKYCSSEIYRNKLTRGEIQFGRASFYRRKYHEGASFGDEFEGISTYKAGRKVFGEDQDFAQALHLKTGGRIIWNGSFDISPVARYSMEKEDFFLLSFSTEYNKTAHKKFAKNDNYDLCLKIENTMQFLKEIYQFVCNGVDKNIAHLNASPTNFTMRADHVQYVDIPAILEGQVFLHEYCKDLKLFGDENEFRVSLKFLPDITTPAPEYFRPKIATLGEYFTIYKRI